MKTKVQTQRIAELLESAKQRFGDFSETKKQEIFLTVKEAKARGLLRKQPADRCLSEYVNAANHLLRSYATDEFTAALNQNLDYIAVLKKVRYALCPMPYALCPMPMSTSYESSKGYR